MDSVAVTVPLRPPTKKMKKRKELDALAPSHVVSRRTSGKRSSQELLSDSSDERSEYWNISMRGNRKRRARRTPPYPGLLRACSAFFGCASILATASLIWLFIDVRQQLTSLRTEVDQAIAGSEALPEALQKCHSASQKLEKNQTILFSQLNDVKGQIADFSLQLSDIQKGLRQVQDKLNSAPELTNIPTELKDVKKSVATFGSSIRDLGATVNGLKGTDTKIQEIQTSLLKNITVIQNTLVNLSNITQRPEISTNETRLKTEELSQSISQLKTDLVSVNETLTRNLTWVSNDQQKDHTLLVSLQDSTQNASSKVLSLQGECAKATEQSKIIESVEKLTNSLTEVQGLNTDLKSKIAQLELGYSKLNNSTNDILNKIATINVNDPNSNSESSHTSDGSTQTAKSQSQN
ncbi:uncharacterized protein LOC135162188 [Diachasmimorpha longicaudata]|uniref:uncharacterized protein LOC135162188 n=1 Tax=Diachasmimorpha longicaudata TaxID=58733 RepID=UPI0030B8CE67